MQKNIVQPTRHTKEREHWLALKNGTVASIHSSMEYLKQMFQARNQIKELSCT